MTGHRRSARACEASGDVGRAAVYACELAAFDGTDLEDERSFEEVERFIRSIAAGPWWTGPVGDGSPGSCRHGVVRRGGFGRATPAHRSRSVSPTANAPFATAAHELAHALAGVEHGHDARVPAGLPRRRGDGIQPRPARSPRHHPCRPTGRSVRVGRPDAGRASMAAARCRHRGSHRAVAAIRWPVRARRVSRLRTVSGM